MADLDFVTPDLIPGLPDAQNQVYTLPGGSYLFNRIYQFSIQPPGGLPSGTTPAVPGSSFSQLRLTFDIEKNSFSTPNKAKIGVYNLNADARSTYLKGSSLVLKAGYGSSPASQQDLLQIPILFSGIVSGQVKDERKGADIITTFECGSGEQQLLTSFINQTFPPSTSVASIITVLISALGLPAGFISGIPATAIYNQGIVLSGGVKASLDAITRTYGLQWFVQNGSVNILPIGTGLTSAAIAVSQETGLIGVPSNGDGGDNIVTFTSLLNPKLLPGVHVFLKSRYFNGIYTIQKSHFEGDSHDSKWQVNCECVKGLSLPTG